jgi:RNA polymerase sigma factor (sigma-70 family)
METAIPQRATIDHLYEANAPDARRLAYLLVGDRAQAEDICQDAFVRVLGRFGDMRNPGGFRTYLMRTVVSLSKNHFRRKALERRHARAAVPQVVELPERDHALLEALAGLPPRQRAALVLRYCEDLSEQRTAQILQTSNKAVRSLVTRGLAALRKEVTR